MAGPPTLRLTQASSQGATHTITLEWLGAGPRQTASATVSLALSEQDQQDIRWYVEEYPEYPFTPHPERAARIEARMRDVGQELFNALFAANDRTLRLWAKVADQLDDLRIEIVTDAEGATALPWELLCDPATDTMLALHAQAFVRAAPEVPRQALALSEQHVIRILLVICRPAGGGDVPFRSVATRLIKGLSEEALSMFRLDVLRPPTFARLAQVLRDAKARGEPYHVVHFDGHGVYGRPDVLRAELSRLKYRADTPQGFLLFESGVMGERQELIHGSKLGELLVQCDVPLLILNACRSAHADQPKADEEVDGTAPPAEDNPYEKVRAFGSLAQQVMLAGVGGVVAMRYNVYVVTAAQFVAELYRALVLGLPLGEAASRGRKHLYEQPVREIIERLALQDWLVPIVYEAEPMRLCTPPVGVVPAITIKPAGATPGRGTLDAELPKEPDVGFFGRDDTLLALDRAFDQHHAVLLHAYAGSGKTTAAAEFARWYNLTGGVDGPVLFTSFEQYKPLTQVLDQLGRLFDPLLQRSGIQWDAITNLAEKRDLALQILRQVPVLWVWDNVEPIAGFPAGTPSTWTADEERELADFLRAARGTRAKFLLTSRREEHGWLGELPARVELPPMPMHERRQLAEALADKHRVKLDQTAWRPLLAYSAGNPLTLTVVVGQALRDGLRTAKQIQDYVQRLRVGEAAFDDDEREGRSKSLAASLSYGFTTAFSAEERAILALLHRFQGFILVDALIWMGDTSKDWHVPVVAGLSRDEGIALLDRAAEVGLLAALGDGYYRIHPALPWFFRRLYDDHYTAPLAADPRLPTPDPTRAYIEAIGALGDNYHNQFIEGNRSVIIALKAEEANLLHTWRLARQHGWYRGIISAMQGLRALYAHTGQLAAWQQMVAEAAPAFVDMATDGPLPGREEEWALMTGYRVQLLREERQWAEAARLQDLVVDYSRRQSAPLLALPPEQLDSTQRNTLHSLAASLHELGVIQREQGAAACVDSYQESYDLSLRIGAHAGAASCAFGLGNAYVVVPVLRDLVQAEGWYRRDLELTPESDRVGKGKALGELGRVAYERFLEAQQARQPRTVLEEYLNIALHRYQEALQMFPPDAVNALATTQHQLGLIYSAVVPAYLEQAVAHYREAIRFFEVAGDFCNAAQTRQNVAIAYARAGRFDDALLFARAALRSYDQLGPAAAAEAAEAQQLITAIEQDVRGGRGG